jgi:hypothetical protein
MGALSSLSLVSRAFLVSEAPLDSLLYHCPCRLGAHSSFTVSGEGRDTYKEQALELLR